MWMCRYSLQCFHLKSCPVRSSHAPTALPHFQTLPVTSAAWFYFQPKTGVARRWSFLYMEKKYRKIVSASEAENCVRCPNRFPPFFSSKPFIHQACLWCSGHLWSPSMARCLSVAVGVCQRERLRADFAHAARRAYPPWYPRSTPTLQRLDWLLKKPWAFQLEARSTAACVFLHIWMVSQPWAAVYTLCTLHTLRTLSTLHTLRTVYLCPWACHTVGAHSDSLLAIWRDLKVHIISEHK